MAEQVSTEEDVKSGLVTRSGIARSCIVNIILTIRETKQTEDTVATERNSNYPCWTEMSPPALLQATENCEGCDSPHTSVEDVHPFHSVYFDYT